MDKRQLKIGIDARFYGPKQKGLGRYVQKLIESLEEKDKKNEYVIFLSPQNWSEYSPKNPNFEKVLANARWYGLKEQWLMPLRITQAGVDLVHFPHFNVPLFCPAPFVVTIHDLILRRFPTRRASRLGSFRYWFKNLAYRLVISSALRRAKKVISVSKYTRDDILRYFRIKPEKIEVVYEGAPDPVYEKSEKKEPLLLYVGNAYPHKNLERLILSFEKLKSFKDLKLVLVGEKDYFYRRLEREFSHVKKIVFAGYVSDSELESLYRRAFFYVFPSLCEGFGLPPLEAMANGLPVVSSSSTCLPEILGDAALYFDPEDIDQMTKKIKQVLKDGKLRQKMVSLGLERTKKYNWSKTGEKTLKVYRSVD